MKALILFVFALAGLIMMAAYGWYKLTRFELSRRVRSIERLIAEKTHDEIHYRITIEQIAELESRVSDKEFARLMRLAEDAYCDGLK